MNDARSGQAPGALGPMFKTCQVTAVGDMDATAVDQWGRDCTITVNVLRSPYRPKVNERWVLDRSLGFWTFAALIAPPAPLDRFVATSPNSPAAWNVVHGLGTEDVQVSVRETASGLITALAVHVEDENTVQVTLASSHPVGYYTTVVIG